MSILEKFKDELIFEVQKEFWDERGKGARYRLTRLGVAFIKDQLGDKVKDKENIKKWLVENGFCKEVTFIEDKEISLTMLVKGCCLKPVKESFIKKNIAPLSCPIANMFMYNLELETGLAPELLPIEEEDGGCKITLAKMASSDVVKP
ncbi:hypothetical protein L1766_04810 [Thermovorax subterraneus]|jgi:hypothetical protein|nr:hypothetical protein [Thermovorax subterraneus]